MVLNLDPCHVQVLHCSHCQFLTLSVSRLLEHCHTHRQASGIVFYQCEACGLVGTHQSLLVEHARAWHRDVEPVPVKILSRSTVSNEALVTSACAFCDFTCSDDLSETNNTEPSLSEHYQTQHNVKNVTVGSGSGVRTQPRLHHDQARPEGDPDLGVAAAPCQQNLRLQHQRLSLRHRRPRRNLRLGDFDDEEDDDCVVGDMEDDGRADEAGVSNHRRGTGDLTVGSVNGVAVSDQVEDEDFAMATVGVGDTAAMRNSSTEIADCLLPSHGLTLTLVPDGPPPQTSATIDYSDAADADNDPVELPDDEAESSTTASVGPFGAGQGSGGGAGGIGFGDDDDIETDDTLSVSHKTSLLADSVDGSTPLTVPPLLLYSSRPLPVTTQAAASSSSTSTSRHSTRRPPLPQLASLASPMDDSSSSLLAEDSVLYAASGRHMKCDKCEMVFGSAKALNHHQSRAHGTREELCCAECRTRFASTFSLQEHTLLVHGRIVELWCCDVCQRVFTHLSSMRRHKRLAHSNQKPIHSCGQCGMVFSRKDKLLLHHRRHIPCSMQPPPTADAAVRNAEKRAAAAAAQTVAREAAN
ncbi:hypothetical protein BOX15_Mlig002829g2 [Macrostomum lignano]|uniref:C2H2-type domain-containing protein n=1 Tax=Macrostomum lignano TaxID=282301 RepID=A0A267FSU0_9PLAT|nr:hypothetical protein BOX15_Mlig002829g2 [Macrostomum lignano]